MFQYLKMSGPRFAPRQLQKLDVEQIQNNIVRQLAVSQALPTL